MKDNRTPNHKLVAWRRDLNLASYWHHYNSLFVKDGVLYKSLKTNNAHPDPAIVVPKSLEIEILKGTHDGPFAGHLGVTRTLDRVRKRFFWPKMRTTIENYIRQCDICVQRKAPSPTANNGKAPIQTLEVSEPFTFWALDYMGPLPESGRGNKHILVLMDHFTKWCEAFPTPDQKAVTVAKILVDRVFS